MIHLEAWYREAAGLSSEISRLVKRIEQGNVEDLEELLQIHRRTGKWPTLRIPSESVPEAFSILEREARRGQDTLSPQIFNLLLALSIRSSKRPDLPMEWYRKWYTFMENKDDIYSDRDLALFFFLMYAPQDFDEVLDEKLGPPQGLDWRLLVNIAPFDEADTEGTALHYYVHTIQPLYEEVVEAMRWRGRVESGDLDRIDIAEKEWKTRHLPALKNQVQEWVNPENDPYGIKRRPEAVEWRSANPGAWERMQRSYRILSEILSQLNELSANYTLALVSNLFSEVNGVHYDLRGAMSEYVRDGMLTFPFTDLYDNLEERVRDFQERFKRLPL